jgi:hypothetical protein
MSCAKAAARYIERLADRHGANLRYCHPWGKWLVYDGTRWRVDVRGAHLEPWEIQRVPSSLGYTGDLADGTEIATAVEVAQGDWPQWRAA